MNKIIKRSPFFYVGDKYKLMPQLTKLFPSNINNYVEPFVGGGSSFLNVEAKHYSLNDNNAYVIELHKTLSGYSGQLDRLLKELFSIIDEYNFSCSFLGNSCSDELKKQFKKTYYSHYNKESYNKLKESYNIDKDPLKLYILLIYGFNHMIRFNKSGLFNLPVGNVDFNSNVHYAIKNYIEFIRNRDITFFNEDYSTFLNKIKLDPDSFVYFDPPYLISASEYNKEWGDDSEIELYKTIDLLNDRGIMFGITNLVSHKGNRNEFFENWSKKYYSYNIKSNYISFNDNTIKADSREVYVTNVQSKI